MICIQCLHPVPALYTVYANGHIQLTTCSYCNTIADEYVEIDDVILFIDILLLKPGAFRHIVFNSLEERVSKIPDWFRLQGSVRERSITLFTNISNWSLKYDQIIRYWILITTFEVYLRWTEEDNKAREYFKILPTKTKIVSDLITSRILLQDFFHQYIYVAIFCVIDMLVLYFLTIGIITKWFKWGQDNKYSVYILSYTVLISYGAKILPTLMLIWPYDTISYMGIIKWVANLYLIESLKIITRLPYSSIVFIFVVVSIFRMVVPKLLLACIFSNSSDDLQSMLNAEYVFAIQKYIISKDFF
ncbi:hypothetical protein TPHA_0C02320 [Tetrapisispora phaffii CBS 4417]|uniref:Protein ARV n=1 Tax=Tetrapisispora phaffii (strain ATCC 24235 / CBS 4417 / NBRC 1672 / NRRL Y-8282 / UCD 70-5) TaxID=1071381 RepID=G8BRK9_TETPH|nr:hypothetical protein TPHA_0C02320 [Tetrapisispora phaffii CBS 4417]CCE62385.1 hypothetical protein TPHA_0C02320 [Tetrapisispora phaffii CBS 4417]